MAALAPRVGQVVRRLREASDLSQEELAAEAGLHRTYISLVERGRRNITVEALSQIAEALNIYPHQLIEEAEKVADPGATRASRGRRRAR